MIFSYPRSLQLATEFVLVEQRVTWQAGRDRVRQATLSFSLTHVSTLRLSPEASPQASSATHDASLANGSSSCTPAR